MQHPHCVDLPSGNTRHCPIHCRCWWAYLDLYVPPDPERIGMASVPDYLLN